MFVEWYVMNLLLVLRIFQSIRISARWRQLWIMQPQSFSKQDSGWVLLYARHVLNVVKKMKFEINLVFWICFIVACSFIESFKDMAVNKFKKPCLFQRACVL